MKIRVGKLLLLLSLSFFVVVPALGAEQDAIEVVITVQKVEIQGGGEEVFAGAERVRPGDVIQYQILYRVRGKDEILELFAQLPIPDGMEYISDSAQPTGVQGSIDGKEFLPVPLQRQIESVKGGELLEAIPLAEYRFLGWPMRGLAPGDEVFVSARFRVNFISEESK